MNVQLHPVSDSVLTEPLAVETVRSWREILPNPRTLWMVFRRHLFLFLLVFILVAGAAAAWTVLQTPIYAAGSSIVVQPKQDNVVNVQSVAPELPATTDVVDTQVRLMRSAALALRVAEAYADRTGAELASREERIALAGRMRSMVRISRSGSTYVIDIEARSANPGEAALVANLFATEFVERSREAKSDANSVASSWLLDRTRQLAREARAAEAALQRYRINNGLMSANGATLAEQELSTVNQEIAAAQADLAEKQGRLAAARVQLRQGSGGADVGAALGSGTIGTLRAREAQASAQVAQLTETLGPLHPQMREARRQLDDARDQIQREINRILSNLEADVRTAESRLASLQGTRSQSTGLLAANNAAAVGLSELERRAEAARRIYETFLTRSRETSAQQGLQQPDVRVEQLAQPPAVPDFPDRRLAVAFGLVAALSLAFVAIAISEYLQRGLRTKDDVERRLGIPYAGAIPSLGSTLKDRRDAALAPHDYLVSHPFSTFSESFRALRTFLLVGTGAGSSSAVAIASALPQEGKTTSAICLARICAMGGIATVLVDCDLRRRGSSQLLAPEVSAGLADFLTGRRPLDDCLVKDEATGLQVLAASGEASQLDLLGPEQVARLIAELRRRFQAIILDTAPVLGVADARVVAAHADQVLMVSRWRATSIGACQATIDALADVNAKIAGIALTQVDIRQYASTGLRDAYGYQKKFKEYYVN